MFTAKLKPKNDEYKTLCQGSIFAKVGSSTDFEIARIDNTFPPIEVSFIALRDSEKKELAIEKSDMQDRKMVITYYNPTTGTSGPTEPVKILQNETMLISIIFRTEFISKSEIYKFSYEIVLQNKSEVL